MFRILTLIKIILTYRLYSFIQLNYIFVMTHPNFETVQETIHIETRESNRITCVTTRSCFLLCPYSEHPEPKSSSSTSPPCPCTTPQNSPQTSIIGPQGALHSHAYCITHPCSKETPITLFQASSAQHSLSYTHDTRRSLRPTRMKTRSLNHPSVILLINLIASEVTKKNHLSDEKLQFANVLQKG